MPLLLRFLPAVLLPAVVMVGGCSVEVTVGEPSSGTARVLSVTDGDTVRLASGEAVRLVGIDTPERGECGYVRASRVLERLVLDEEVVLTAPVDDTDRYGRLLRYVDVDVDGLVVDAGLRLLERGFAVARYDSRDGYDRHPREDDYRQADRVARGYCD